MSTGGVGVAEPLGLPGKILAVHGALHAERIPHAFGGALALAWCTQRARGTIDIDLNIFVDVGRAADVFASLPEGVVFTVDDLALIERDGQVRLWWDGTPIDVFLNTTGFHEQAADRVRTERFLDNDVPFLCCDDLAVFKAFFDRTKDWADLEDMWAAGTLDIDRVIGVLVRYLGGGDERIEQIRQLSS